MDQEKTGIEVIIEDLTTHPKCAHGPTLLFSRVIDTKNNTRQFFACSACRDRRDCSFFLWADEDNKLSIKKKEVLEIEKQKLMPKIDHQKAFIQLNKIRQTFFNKRCYCHTCNTLFNLSNLSKHLNHIVTKGITDHILNRPTKLFHALHNNKKEAQYLFSKSSIEFIVSTLFNLSYKHVVCIGAPRIHEHIQNLINESNATNCSSLLLDLDRRHHIFNGPLQFCWYNSFNHHFFNKESKHVFDNFLQTNGGHGVCVVTDPPFGGRLEPLAETIKTISTDYKKANNTNNILPVIVVMPYFMEPWMQNTMPQLNMSDYKVTYDNHSKFNEGLLSRKQGSTVRLFTNIPLSQICLPVSEGYRYCNICDIWVSLGNQHCKFCKSCTSKDGRTYVHCHKCKRCVKPTWGHCKKCNRCCQIKHKCGEFIPKQNCFHCHQFGHKKSECPVILEKTPKRPVKKNENNVNKKVKLEPKLKGIKVNKKKLRRARIKENRKNKI